MRKTRVSLRLVGRLATEEFHQPVDQPPHPRRKLALRGIQDVQRQRRRQPFAEDLAEAAVGQPGLDVITRRLELQGE